MGMTASLLIRARETGFDRIASKAKAMGAAFRPVVKTATDVGRAINRIDDRVVGRFAKMGASARKFARDFRLAEVAAYKTGQAVGSALRGTARFGLNMAKWGATAAIAGASWVAVDIIGLASKFEQFQVVLENTEGSALKARKAMAWVRDFAKTTPYEVEKVMEAYVALKSYGLDPMDGTLKALGNTASGMNKDIMQAVEMLADAQTGEFERLKEFGIRAKVQGDTVKFTYMKAGREITKTAKYSAREINRALVGIMDERFSGMMDRQSRTLAGTWSNIKDMFAGFQLDIADAGVFDLIKKKAEGMLARVQAWAKDGSLKAWAVDASDSLEDMVEWGSRFVTDTDWKSVAADVRTLASAFGTVVGWMVLAIRWAGKLKAALDDAAALFVLMNGSAQGKINAANYFAGRAYGGSRPPKAGPGPVAMPGRADGKKYSMTPTKGPARVKAPSGFFKAPKIGGAVDIRVRTDPGVRTQTRVASASRDVPLRMANIGRVSTG